MAGQWRVLRGDALLPVRSCPNALTDSHRPRLNENRTGLAQTARLGPTLRLKTPVKALKLAHNVGQPCAMFVLQPRPAASLTRTPGAQDGALSDRLCARQLGGPEVSLHQALLQQGLARRAAVPCVSALRRSGAVLAASQERFSCSVAGVVCLRPVVTTCTVVLNATAVAVPAMEGERDATLAQELGQLQPFLAVFPQECAGQLASFGPT